MTSLLEQARARLDEAARLAQVDGDIIATLKHPQWTAKTTLAVPMDDSTCGYFDAWHCRHDLTREPANGRLDIRPFITMQEVEGLALLGTIKAAILELPFGGAAGGVRADPALLSGHEVERVRRCFAERLSRWTHTSGERSASIGGFRLLQDLGPELGLGRTARVSIVGLGRVGRQVARLLNEAGYAIVAAGDASETVAAHAGIAVAKLLAAKDAGLLGAVCAERGVARLAAGAAIGADCDLLVLAGPPGLIDRANAREVRAAVVLELTDGGVHGGADQILEDRGVVVLPDLLASAGAAAERHLDRMLDGGIGAWASTEVDDWIARLILPAARMAWSMARSQSVSLRRATHLLALSRLATASEVEGRIAR